MDIARILRDTEKLCVIDTETGNQAGAMEAIACLESMSPPGTNSKIMSGSSPGAGPDLLLTVQGSGSGGVLLLGHYDTVPSPPGMEPFGVEGDFMRGLGVCDMKSGLALMMQLMREISDYPSDFGVVHALIVGDEEWRAAPLRHRMYPWPGVGGVLGFERADLEARVSLVLERYGAAVLSSKVKAEALRAEKPLPGPSSIAAAGELVSVIDSLDRNLDRIQLTPTSLEAPSAINVVPAEARVESLIRFASEEQLQRLLSALPDQAGGCSVEHGLDRRVPGLFASLGSVELVRGLEAEFPGLEVRSVAGAGDVSWMAEGFDVVLDGLGPAGDGEHSLEERASLVSIEPQYQLARAAAWSIISGSDIGDPRATLLGES